MAGFVGIRRAEDEKAYYLAFSDEDERALQDEKAYYLAFSDEDERALEDQKTYASLFDEDGSTSAPMNSEDERGGADSTSANESEEKPYFSFFDEDPPFSM
jgi:hypothetical protein